MIEKEVVLEVKNLKKYFPASHKRVLKAVDDVSLRFIKEKLSESSEDQRCGKSDLRENLYRNPYEDRRTGVVSGKRCASDE